jgi:hypothetical protein
MVVSARKWAGQVAGAWSTWEVESVVVQTFPMVSGYIEYKVKGKEKECVLVDITL